MTFITQGLGSDEKDETSDFDTDSEVATDQSENDLDISDFTETDIEVDGTAERESKYRGEMPNSK